MSALAAPRPLGPDDPCERFDSGSPLLDRWLAEYADHAARAGSARTYVSTDGDRIAGYYALAAGDVAPEDAPRRLAAGMPAHPIPVVLLARLAVDRDYQGRGVGRDLLADATRRTLGVAQIIGVRALVVDALDERAAAFYRHHGFTAFGEGHARLYALPKDLRAALTAE